MMWDDRIYRKAINFFRLSLLGVVSFLVGAGMHSYPLMAAGGLFVLCCAGYGIYLIFKMVWND